MRIRNSFGNAALTEAASAAKIPAVSALVGGHGRFVCVVVLGVAKALPRRVVSGGNPQIPTPES
jgi:hypothetical protein